MLDPESQETPNFEMSELAIQDVLSDEQQIPDLDKMRSVRWVTISGPQQLAKVKHRFTAGREESGKHLKRGFSGGDMKRTASGLTDRTKDSGSERDPGSDPYVSIGEINDMNSGQPFHGMVQTDRPDVSVEREPVLTSARVPTKDEFELNARKSKECSRRLRSKDRIQVSVEREPVLAPTRGPSNDEFQLGASRSKSKEGADRAKSKEGVEKAGADVDSLVPLFSAASGIKPQSSGPIGPTEHRPMDAVLSSPPSGVPGCMLVEVSNSFTALDAGR